MDRIPIRVFLSVLLLFGQFAAQMHAMSHLRHDIAVAEHGPEKAPALGHGTDKCVAFGALANVLGNAVVAQAATGAEPATLVLPANSVFVPARIAFDSRAPPALS